MQVSSSAIQKVKTLVAFTISTLTVFSALLGWQMGNISGDASGEYAAAQRAELNAQKVASINTLNASENQRSFLTYRRYYDQYQWVSNQLRDAERASSKDEALLGDLRRRQLELRALYSSNLKLFPNKFITRAGTYNKDAQLGQMWASASRELDLDPKPHLQAGQKLDKQVRNMQVALVLLAISLFFFAIVSTVESLRDGMLLTFVALGYLFSASGVAFGVLNWKTFSPLPIALPARVASPTSTPVPSPTFLPPTRTPVPTALSATPTPEIQRFFSEEFDENPQNWTAFTIDRSEQPYITREGFSEVSLGAEDGRYLFDIQRRQTSVYSLYDPLDYEDVRLDVRVENLGSNDISVSLVCRQLDQQGWYEFNIANNGLYEILYASPSPTGFLAYRKIYNGGSTRINAGKAVNEYGIRCQGRSFSLWINGELTREITDHLSTPGAGKVGVSVSSYNVLPATVRLDWIKVSQP